MDDSGAHNSVDNILWLCCQRHYVSRGVHAISSPAFDGTYFALLLYFTLLLLRNNGQAAVKQYDT